MTKISSEKAREKFNLNFGVSFFNFRFVFIEIIIAIFFNLKKTAKN